jgi:hypothetical protein
MRARCVPVEPGESMYTKPSVFSATPLFTVSAAPAHSNERVSRSTSALSKKKRKRSRTGGCDSVDCVGPGHGIARSISDDDARRSVDTNSEGICDRATVASTRSRKQASEHGSSSSSSSSRGHRGVLEVFEYMICAKMYSTPLTVMPLFGHSQVPGSGESKKPE